MRNFVIGLAAIAVMVGTPALAADMAVKTRPQPPAPPPPVYSWTGCYVGAVGGGAWGSSNWIFTDDGNPDTGPFSLAGWTVGGTFGCNYQVSAWVFGVENDISWINKSGEHEDVTNNDFHNYIKERWIDTLRGRLGYSFGNFFVYGTGGVAWVGAQMSACDFSEPLCESQSTTRTGWTAGAGIEVSLAQNWSLKAEYLYADFGHTSFPSQNEDFSNRTVSFNDNLLRIGLNYRFGWGPFGKGPANY